MQISMRCAGLAGQRYILNPLGFFFCMEIGDDFLIRRCATFCEEPEHILTAVVL